MVDLSNGRGWINPGPAASIARIDKALGRPLHITEAGRSFFQQQVFYEAWLNGTGNYALSPYAPSIHQVGDAIDTGDWWELTALLNEHGWFQTVFWPDGSLREGWHFEYDASRDQHINDHSGENAAPAPAEPEEEDEDMKETYVWWKNAAGKQQNLVYATGGNGMADHWESDNGTYNTRVAKAHNLAGPTAEISESHGTALLKKLAEQRAGK